MIRTSQKPILALFGVFCSPFTCVLASCFHFWMFSWCIISHSVFCVFVCVSVCTHSGIITSCLSWLEMVSLIPLHHMSGFICVLCQELMEFFARLALKVFEDTRPDVMCIQPPAQFLLIDLLSFCLLYGCFCFSWFCHIFSNLNEFLDETPCQFICVYVSGASITHHCIHQKQHRHFPFVFPLQT